CRRTSVDESAPQPHRDRDIEEEASAFAAELLMPRMLFVREHARLNGDVEALCRTFDSSRVAMERRVATVFSDVR
ncbi:MAG: ImmA/IrrE family metallo-endopeptidase, partial [Egibacteraceae bacterium]